MTHDASDSAVDPAKLQQYLEERLARHCGRVRAIASISRRPCPYASSFRIDELNVRFKDGSHVRLVIKNLGIDGMLEQARQVRPTFLYEPKREIDTYHWVLPHGPAGTPEWYGAVTHGSSQRHWLLLEQVIGTPLWQVGNVAAWERTAEWIARFHRAFSPEQARKLATRADLLEYNSAFYWRWMQRAQRFAAGDTTRQRAIDRIARGYDAVVTRLSGLPRTIIHGEFYPSNVLIGKRRGMRVCPLDWEMTALGPGLVDLATLSAGWAAPTARALACAYFAEAQGLQPGAAVRLPSDFSIDLACCQLHLAVRMLGWSDHWQPPARQTRNWLGDAVRLSERLAGKLSGATRRKSVA